jgi:hypothetical protein
MIEKRLKSVKGKKTERWATADQIRKTLLNGTSFSKSGGSTVWRSAIK